MKKCLMWLFVVAIVNGWVSTSLAQGVRPLSDGQRLLLENGEQDLRTQLDRHLAPRSPAWGDANIFAKGLAWALRYDREFTTTDEALLEKALQRGQERLAMLSESQPSWTMRRGKSALGYVSKVDGSVQPYGIIVPARYDPAKPIRLDVVLHGSTKPLGISELRFIGRFDEGDAPNPSSPDHPWIELHPLGRVENCYRWSGETDVFEAIDDVCRRFNIDRNRIVLRGMSMGASGTWHLGLKRPDRFAALGPYCGYVDTHRFSETPLPNFVRISELPDHQELGLHMLDSIDYAANAGVVPVVACMGEKDIFFQAHVLMRDAMQREGLTLTNLISPGTGHVIDPQTHAEQLRRIGEFVDVCRREPRELRFVTWTLKYSRCHWLEVLGLERHYARAELSAKLKDTVLQIDEPRNITRFAIDLPQLPETPKGLQIGDVELPIPVNPHDAAKRLIVVRREGKWEIERHADLLAATGKRPGLQGPIDDAFTGPFLCVRGTGQPWNAAAKAYAEASLDRFAEEWRRYFRGELPIKNDVDVTTDDVQNRHLILFGDPGSNFWIAKALPQLPVHWTRDTLRLGGREYPSVSHIPALIARNPLPGAGERYVVLNSGHTFRESELSLLNYLLFPRWGDWAVIQTDAVPHADQKWPDRVRQAGYFNEQWREADLKP